MKQVELEKVKLYVENELSKEFIIDHVDAYKDITESLRINIRGIVWGTAEPYMRQEVTYPLTWWDAVKDRFFPKWLLRWFPVTYQHIVIDVRELYPNFKPRTVIRPASLVIQRYNEINEEKGRTK